MMLLALILGIASIFGYNADAMTLTHRSGRASMPVRKHMTCTSLHGWNGDNNNDDMISNFFGRGGAASNNKEPTPSSSSTLITPQMEEEVLASARATMDARAVSRAVSSLLIDDDRIETTRRSNAIKGGSNRLRDLAAGKVETNKNSLIANTSTITKNVDSNNNNNNDSDNTSWNTQQIAIASGATVMLLSPVVIPIIHVLLPPIIPSPSSVSFTGAALLGALSYIVALGDPTDQSNIISSTTSGPLGEGVEVGGAVSRIVGRTALQSVKASAPRVKAVARAALDYDTTTATLEELKNRVDYLSRKTLELDDENQLLRYEVALFNAVEDVSSMYKLEELKELARYRGVRGYSTESKNALLRKLVKEQVLELDLTPYYDSLGDRL
jgi:hypothetical protein